MMKSLLLIGSAVAAVAVAAPAAAQSSAIEQRFDAQISAADQQQWLQQMSSAPNHVGSPHDKANAEMTLALLKQWGWDARIETFDVLYPTPISTTLELVAPQQVTLGGQEPPVAEDPTSNLEGMLPPYVAYQGDGDVTAPVVYVNYGMPDDYDELARRGITLECCPTSNVALGVFSSYEEHPLRRLADAGVRVTLGSDDPPYFGASIGGEYDIARQRLGFDEAGLKAITSAAIDAAFCDDGVKTQLEAKL